MKFILVNRKKSANGVLRSIVSSKICIRHRHRLRTAGDGADAVKRRHLLFVARLLAELVVRVQRAGRVGI